MVFKLKPVPVVLELGMSFSWLIVLIRSIPIYDENGNVTTKTIGDEVDNPYAVATVRQMRLKQIDIELIFMQPMKSLKI